MFQLSDFYGYCKQNDVDVMPFAMLPRAACTVRDGQNYAVVLNFKRLHTVRQMRTARMRTRSAAACRRTRSARQCGQAAQSRGSWQNILTWTKTT